MSAGRCVACQQWRCLAYCADCHALAKPAHVPRKTSTVQIELTVRSVGGITRDGVQPYYAVGLKINGTDVYNVSGPNLETVRPDAARHIAATVEYQLEQLAEAWQDAQREADSPHPLDTGHLSPEEFYGKA